VQLLKGSAPAVQQGTWTVTLAGTKIVNGDWHAWIEFEMPLLQFVGPQNKQVTITIPGTSSEVITAASYISKGPGVGSLSSFSSRGPTRDGRTAPTIAAPGQSIMSANSDAGNSTTQYRSDSGTSMAAPHIAGAVALLFQASPTLTQQQIIGRLIDNARFDFNTGAVPNNDWGAGKLDAETSARMDEAKWVTALYVDLLARAPDAPGLDYWVALRVGGAHLKVIVDGFLTSNEYCTNLVTSFYTGLLARQPDPAGLQWWVGQLQGGVPRHEVLIGFLDSAEYKANNALPDQFVESLYNRLLGRGSDPSGKQGWVDALSAGASTADVIRGFLFSEEYCTQRVTELYTTLLARAPDPAGLIYWVGIMSKGVPFQEIQYGFLASDEYRARPLILI
jgi:Subtilase family/Domain of unknown function (DUF4214)